MGAVVPGGDVLVEFVRLVDFADGLGDVPETVGEVLVCEARKEGVEEGGEMGTYF